MGSGSSKSGNEDAPPDLYSILQVDITATQDEIKKSFRKLALKYHPDKTQGDEAATKHFLNVQRAYEVLSDDQERAWYDNHREELARGPSAASQDVDVDLAKAQARGPNLSARQLMRYFDARLWKAFDDSDKGFYTIYRDLFDLIIKDEMLAMPYPGDPPLSNYIPEYPSFGYASSNYDSESQGIPAIKQFYSVFANNFSSRKSFAAFDEYKTSEAPDRRYKRAMEKENRRAREEARQAYNDTVRQLASFLKKRDPRFLHSNSADPMKMKALQAEKQMNDLKNAAIERAQRREKEAREYKEQEWQKTSVSPLTDEDADSASSDSELDSQGDDNDEEDASSEEEPAIDDFYCPACEKNFQSQGAWTNHERSKKHKVNLSKLKTLMQQEEEEGGEFAGTPSLASTVESTPLASVSNSDIEQGNEMPRSSKRKKKRRRQQKDQVLKGDADLAPEEQVAEHVQELDLNGDENGNASEREQSTEPQLSKKDKRRAKEAAKKAAQSTFVPRSEICNVCQEEFSTRNLLFKHVNEFGHALASKTPNKGRGKGRR